MQDFGGGPAQAERLLVTLVPRVLDRKQQGRRRQEYLRSMVTSELERESCDLSRRIMEVVGGYEVVKLREVRSTTCEAAVVRCLSSARR